MHRTAGQLVAIAVFLVVWEVASRSVAAQTGDIPHPWDTAERLADLAGQATYWGAVGDTLANWAVGFALAVAIGVPAGLAVGASRTATASSRLTVDFLRTIPPVALIPLTIMLFGPNRPMVVTLIVIGAVWPLFVQATYAAQQVEPTLQQVAASFRFPWWFTALRLRLPSALPFVWTGLRIGANLGLLVSIAGELLGGVPGLGNELNLVLLAGDNAAVFAYALTAGVLGVAQSALFTAGQRVLLHWHPTVRGGRR
ncbi:ABC transporter permease [Streptomyces sp. NPDC002577]